MEASSDSQPCPASGVDILGVLLPHQSFPSDASVSFLQSLTIYMYLRRASSGNFPNCQKWRENDYSVMAGAHEPPKESPTTQNSV